MRVAAYQAPYLPFGSFEAVSLIAAQLPVCAAAGVEMLGCPESIIGGLAHESDGQSPMDVALSVAELTTLIGPLLGSPITIIVGFTERAGDQVFSAAAVLSGGGVASVYRKVYPGYRTMIAAGTELPVLDRGDARFGVMICNDAWYVEPARILAGSGAAIIFVPTHSGHQRADDSSLVARGQHLPVARAVDTMSTVVVADVAGHCGGRQSSGFTAIVDPDGVVLARAQPYRPGLVMAEGEPVRRRQRDPRGWDGDRNPVVRQRYLDLCGEST